MSNFWATINWSRATVLELTGRVLISLIFVAIGLVGLIDPSEAGRYLQTIGFSGGKLLVWLFLAVNLLGGLLLAIGWRVPQVSFFLACWTLLIGLIEYSSAGRPASGWMFVRVLGLVGGLLVVAGSELKRTRRQPVEEHSVQEVIPPARAGRPAA